MRFARFFSVLGLVFAAEMSAGFANEAVGGAESDAASRDRIRWALGPNHFGLWSGEDPVINVYKNNRPRILDEFAEAGFYDPEVQRFIALPDGADELEIASFRSLGRQAPAYYAGTWVIEWDGDGELQFKQAGEQNQRLVGNNRVESYIGPDERKRGKVVLVDAGKTGVGNIRIYRKKYEDDLKSGRIYRPEFVELVSRYDVVRPMDWNGANGSMVTRADELPVMDEPVWSSGRFPISAQFALSMDTGAALWLNAPPRLAAPDGLNDELLGIKNQDRRVRMISDAFDEVYASQEWEAYADHVVEAMIASGYPLDREIYLELGNEIWNWASGFAWATEWYWAMTRAVEERTEVKYAGNSTRGGYGYFSGRLAEAFAKALKKGGREDQKWAIIIGTQTAWPDQTRGALEGLADYEGDPEFQQPMSRFGVATTGYYSGGFRYGQNNSVLGEKYMKGAWRAEWMRQFEEDPEALAKRIADHLVSDKKERATLGWVMAHTREHARMASEAGAFYFGQYEGSSHDRLDEALGKDVRVREFIDAWHQGPHHARVIKAQADLMRAEFPDAFLSNYMHWGRHVASHGSPWVEAVPWQEPGEAEQMILDLLRPQ